MKKPFEKARMTPSSGSYALSLEDIFRYCSPSPLAPLPKAREGYAPSALELGSGIPTTSKSPAVGCSKGRHSPSLLVGEGAGGWGTTETGQVEQ